MDKHGSLVFIPYNILFREERKAYLNRASRAHHQLNELFSVAIDGMDTNKTELPFSKVRYGTTQKAWHLRVHLVGVLIHGRHPICFLDYHQFPHDSNLMINTLLQVNYNMVFNPLFLCSTIYIMGFFSCF